MLFRSTPADLATLRGCMSRWAGQGEEEESPGLGQGEEESPGLGQGVVDGLGCKASAIQRATEASLTILTDLLSQRPEEEDRSQNFYPRLVSTPLPSPPPSDNTDII